MSHRKYFYFRNDREITIEFSWWSGFSIDIRVDGEERRIVFHLGLGPAIWIGFNRFLPKSWYPTYQTDTYGALPDKSEFGMHIHGGSIWWNFGVNENITDSSGFWHLFKFGNKDRGSMNKTWRYGVWNIVDQIRGKHLTDSYPVKREVHILPFEEGCYIVKVTKFYRLDKYERWFTRRMHTFEVEVGDIVNGKMTASMVPHMGKGENSYDCGMDGTRSSYFWEYAGGGKRIETCFEAALYFWNSCMHDRERRARAGWTPKFVKTRRGDFEWSPSGILFKENIFGRFMLVDAVAETVKELSEKE